MRDWNEKRRHWSSPSEVLFRSYLWGIETLLKGHRRQTFKAFRSYLWGIETRGTSKYIFCELFVQILPMRDWNTALGGGSWCLIWRSDLTYEGLKRRRTRRQNRCRTAFRSYLWGIETDVQRLFRYQQSCSDLTYEGLKLAIRLHVLFRFWSRSDLTYEGLKLTWEICRRFSISVFRSYLWGIETFIYSNFSS